jgi:signal transduction histidine kinase
MEESMSPRRTVSHPFVGNSAMDALLSRFDWARTPVGKPDKWPASWRAAMRVCLDSFVPMVVLLGKEYVMVYNDACVPVVGGKHPRCMGKPAATEWPEIWSGIIEPMVSHVTTTGEPAGSDDLYLPLERNGYPEETHMSFAVSSIREDDGAPTALLVTLRETTEKVLVARMVDCLDALSTRCFPAETAEEACRITGEVTNRYLRDLPFALMYLVDANGQHARLAAHSGLTATPENIAPAVVSLNAEPGTTLWDIAGVVARQTATEAQHVRERMTPYLRDPSFAPQLAITVPLADPSGGVSGVLVMGTNPMRPPAEGRRLAGAVAARLTTAIANAKVKQRTRERAEALAALDRAKTLFLSDVSHEFRTPLTLLLSPLDDVLSRRALSANDRELLQTSRRAATRLLKLVQSMLDFSRVEAGRMQVAFEPADLAAETADLVSLFRSTFERAKLRLIVECAPLPEPVFVDRDMWEKIVLNLVTNAFKFTLSGEVSVRLAARDEWVSLEVRDTGCGIAEADLPRVFERFHRGQTTNARTAEGTGIGLSLVHELVKLHGGTIDVASVVNQGTTVTVRVRRGTRHLPAEHVGVPRRTTALAAAAPFLEEASGWIGGEEPTSGVRRSKNAAGKRSSAGGSAGGGTSSRSAAARGSTARGPNARGAADSGQPVESDERILVVDDNADMRRYLRRILQETWRVDTANDGMAALAKIRKAPPDLIIADLMMPGLDGLSLLGALRDDPRLADIPVMVLSARANEDASIDALSAGADDYLPKPFAARELLARVTVQLARNRLRCAERAAREVAEQSSFMKDELVLMLSNSLRNPLNVMLNTISVLKDQTFGTEDARRALEIIRASTREQHRLIDEVHDLSCITAGCFSVEKALVPSLSALVHSELDAIRPVASARRVRVESFVDSSAGVFEGDANRMRQVVHNLLAHALACTQAGGNVIIECHGRGEFAEVIVRDNGAGIPAETLTHVFDANWQMQHARSDGARAPGVWLGLAVSHRIAELHGGRLFASSDGQGLGSVFTLRLPLQVVAAKVPAAGDEVVSGPFRSSGRVFPKRPSQSPTPRK